MTDLPLPLVLAEVDLTDFPFMPLDVRRIRDSDLAALESPEACWAAVLLWCASWHQVPAASLSDDDRVLANLAGYGRVVKEWLRVREGALRGWVKCADGRLYHPVVAEKANDAWQSKLHHSYGKLKERLRKAYGKNAEFPTFDQWISAGTPSDWPQSSGGNIDSSAGIPAEIVNLPPVIDGDSVGIEDSSAGILTENSLKGEGQGQGYLNQPPTSVAKAPEVVPPSGNSLAKKITFKVWKANVKASGEKLISGYQPVWDYAEKLDIPVDWIEIAWLKFADRYDTDPTYVGKRYADWRRHFLNSIEGNWFGLWRVDQSGKFILTTVGVQADIGTREAA